MDLHHAPITAAIVLGYNAIVGFWDGLSGRVRARRHEAALRKNAFEADIFEELLDVIRFRYSPRRADLL